ncbi:MAG: hypothetical protein IJE43_01135 [Alphaproteobacteria bacterium]|nr:hypothetical protein [Alphaproteobacteria bacterium]
MGKYKPTLKEIYDSYVDEVKKLNQDAIENDKTISAEYKDIPLKELKDIIKELCIKEDKYKERKGNKTGHSRYKTFECEEKYRAMRSYYKDKPEVSKLIKKRMADRERIQARTDISEEYKRYKTGVVDQMVNLKLEIMFDSLPINQQEKVLKDYYIKYISQIKGERDVRDNVRKKFGDNIKFKGEKDKGNCTKAITVSLYNLQEKFGLNIFPNLDDIEKIAHPKDLIEYLKPYVKEAPSGELKDIPDVKEGDIFIFTNDDNEPGHAMMCYEFNEEKEPLVLGFSNNAKGYNGFYNAFYSDKSHPQKGRILDAWSLVRDAYHQKYNAKENIPTIPSKER